MVVLMALMPEALALNPSRTYKQRPEKYNMEYVAADVPTHDGDATLEVWTFKAKAKTDNVLLIAHNGEGNMADYLRHADALTQTHTVVMFDYRGYGESSEFEIDNNMVVYPHFQDDMKTMVDWCRKQHNTATVDLYGWGIGAGLALGVGWTRPDVRRIIADTPFLSMEDLETRFSSWDEPMEVPFAGYDKKHEPLYAITENKPGKSLESVTIIAGPSTLYAEDDYAALAKNPKVTLATSGGFKADKDNYLGIVGKGLGAAPAKTKK